MQGLDTPGEHRPRRRPPETTLDVELAAGLSLRLGSSSSYELSEDQSAGLAYGPSVWLAPNRLFSLGVAYERVALGVDRSEGGTSSVDVRRALDAVWLRGRAYPWREDSVGLFVGLGLGMSWQHVRGTGTRPGDGFTRPPSAYGCDASDGPGIALGGGVGLDVAVSRDVAFLTGFDAAAHRQSGDVIGGCAPGSGSITTLGAHLGFAYRFDLDDSSSPRTSARIQAR